MNPNDPKVFVPPQVAQQRNQEQLNRGIQFSIAQGIYQDLVVSTTLNNIAETPCGVLEAGTLNLVLTAKYAMEAAKAFMAAGYIIECEICPECGMDCGNVKAKREHCQQEHSNE